MPFLKWSEKYSTNVKELDKQNKMLFKIINTFDDAVETRKEEKIVEKTLDSLLDYADCHFKREEELLKQHEYPDFEFHKDQHSRLHEDLFTIYKEYKDGTKDIAAKIAFLLGYWLNDHLFNEDKKYGEFLNSKGIS